MSVELKDAAHVVRGCERELAAAQDRRDALVRAAVKSGTSLTAVAAVAGLSRQRVAQIMAAA